MVVEISKQKSQAPTLGCNVGLRFIFFWGRLCLGCSHKNAWKKQILRFWGKKVFVFFSKFLSRVFGTISICFFHKCRLSYVTPQDDNGTMF